MATPPSSTAERDASAPWNFPTGVRAPATMTEGPTSPVYDRARARLSDDDPAGHVGMDRAVVPEGPRPAEDPAEGVAGRERAGVPQVPVRGRGVRDRASVHPPHPGHPRDLQPPRPEGEINDPNPLDGGGPPRLGPSRGVGPGRGDTLAETGGEGDEEEHHRGPGRGVHDGFYVRVRRVEFPAARRVV